VLTLNRLTLRTIQQRRSDSVKGRSFLLETRISQQRLTWQGEMSYRASLNCVFCGGGEESSSHIFLHCDVVNISFLIPHSLFVHFECWNADV